MGVGRLEGESRPGEGTAWLCCVSTEYRLEQETRLGHCFGGGTNGRWDGRALSRQMQYAKVGERFPEKSLEIAMMHGQVQLPQV